MIHISFIYDNAAILIIGLWEIYMPGSTIIAWRGRSVDSLLRYFFADETLRHIMVRQNENIAAARRTINAHDITILTYVDKL